MYNPFYRVDHVLTTPVSKFDLADCLVLEIARKAGHLPVATFDRQFAALDGAQKL